MYVQTSSLFGEPHQIFFKLKNLSSEPDVEEGKCSCVAGLSERCKHMCAALLHCYRFTKNAVRQLLAMLPLQESGDNRGQPLHPMLQLLIALRFYGAGTFQTVTGDLVRIPQSTVYRAVGKVTLLIAKHLYSMLVRFPQPATKGTKPGAARGDELRATFLRRAFEQFVPAGSRAGSVSKVQFRWPVQGRGLLNGSCLGAVAEGRIVGEAYLGRSSRVVA
ncbi:hypothetical protein HPB52_021498 [Rhipicephalus sanguineus]|uniref:SWIM-type domain-containing protein n=1 Tax=Rhipicephalus sanguineus TaxID=34632 RepID=A0A9D4QER3_RHISA|nr:hypothetical protein HPB52_021498 [Rhipicephalus sanguineus]